MRSCTFCLKEKRYTLRTKQENISNDCFWGYLYRYTSISVLLVLDVSSNQTNEYYHRTIEQFRSVSFV